MAAGMVGANFLGHLELLVSLENLELQRTGRMKVEMTSDDGVSMRLIISSPASGQMGDPSRPVPFGSEGNVNPGRVLPAILALHRHRNEGAVAGARVVGQERPMDMDVEVVDLTSDSEEDSDIEDENQGHELIDLTDDDEDLSKMG